MAASAIVMQLSSANFVLVRFVVILIAYQLCYVDRQLSLIVSMINVDYQRVNFGCQKVLGMTYNLSRLDREAPLIIGGIIAWGLYQVTRILSFGIAWSVVEMTMNSRGTDSIGTTNYDFDDD